MWLWRDVPEAWIIDELERERGEPALPELRLPVPAPEGAPPPAPPEAGGGTRVIVIDL